jgi:hypothetical protein
VSNINEIIPARIEIAPASLQELAQQINQAHRGCEAAAKAGLQHAMNAGRLLIEAKKKVGHGQWLPWLKANFPFSERTAQGYMKVADEVPKLEGPKAKRVADLSYRDALKELRKVAVAEQAVTLTKTGAENLDLVHLLTEMGFPPDPSLVPKKDYSLWFTSGRGFLWIEPSDHEDYFYVTYIDGGGDEEGGGFARGTKAPVLAECIPSVINRLGADAVVLLATNRFEFIHEDWPRDHNHWMFKSQQDWLDHDLRPIRQGQKAEADE